MQVGVHEVDGTSRDELRLSCREQAKNSLLEAIRIIPSTQNPKLVESSLTQPLGYSIVRLARLVDDDLLETDRRHAGVPGSGFSLGFKPLP